MAITIDGSTGVQLDDNDKQQFGTGDDLEIFHDGSHSWLANGTGNLYIKGSDIRFLGTNNDNIIKGLHDGAVELYYDNSLKLKTESTGVSITAGHLYLGDSYKAQFGASQDLNIFHDGTNSHIQNLTGDLKIHGANEIHLQNPSSGEKYIKCVNNGVVELYHNNSKVLWTDSNGFNAQAASGDFHYNFLSAAGNQWGIWNQDNNMRFMEDSTERMRIYSSGNIGAPTGSNIYNASDQRLKENITTLTNGLDKIKALNPVSFNWIDGFCEEEKDKTLYGVIAQEAQVVDSNLVNTFATGTVTVKDQTIENTLTVNEKFIIPLLIKAVQELSAEVDTLKTKVAALEGA